MACVRLIWQELGIGYHLHVVTVLIHGFGGFAHRICYMDK